MDISPKEKKLFSKLGQLSVKKRFAGKTPEEIKEIMANAGRGNLGKKKIKANIGVVVP